MAKQFFRPNINSTCRYEDFCKKLAEMSDKPSNWQKNINKGLKRFSENQRFYVSPKKYFIIEQEVSGGRVIDEYLGVELVELSTKECYFFDPALLLQEFPVINKDGLCYEAKSSAAINRMLYERVKDVKPYITNREFVDAFLRIVGDRHFYFKATRHIGLTPWGKRQCKYTLDCIFVKMPV